MENGSLEIDFTSPEWGAIREYLGTRIGQLSRANEGKRVPFEDTQFIRGQLRELRTLLEMENPVVSQAASAAQPNLYT